MKQYTQCIAAVLALAGSVSLVQAQAVTGTPYLSNMDPSTLNTSPNALYAGWGTSAATFTSSLTGLNVTMTPPSYGSLYYVIPAADVQTLDPGDTQATLTFTVNGDPSAFIWIGTPFILNDNAGAFTLGGYSGSGNPGNPPGVTWNGNVVTETVDLPAEMITAIQQGNDAIYSFNLQLDPAVLAAGSYDITFNSLVLHGVPEPASLSLVGLGAAALLILRRRQ